VLEVEKIQQLIEMMVRHDLVEISLRDGEEEINLRRPQATTSVEMTALSPVAQSPASAAMAGGTNGAPPVTETPPDADLIPIPSPMVGTFYAAADPDSPAFVQVGSSVQPGSVVCILEAMKVFNEIKAEVAGLIERILVKNSDAVEYGQPLFLVRPQ
jgi:acetyl-CoA carboxylase biotin carboxyl carrier protein